MKAVFTINGEAIECLENQSDGTNAIYLHTDSDEQICINCLDHGLIVLDPAHNTALVNPDWYMNADMVMMVGSRTYTIRHPSSRDGVMMVQPVSQSEFQVSFQAAAHEVIIVDSELSDTSRNPVENRVIKGRLDEVFTSVSNGKALVASAITDKGVPTASDAAFAVMAENVLSIPAGGSLYGVYDQAPLFGGFGFAGIYEENEE